MARTGITYIDVAEVCEQIRASSERPTVDRIRTILGTGSRTTINAHKKRWESHQNRLQENPQRISDNLTALVCQLSEQLHLECQAIYDQQSAKDADQITELLAQQQQLSRELSSTEKQLEQTSARNKQLSHSLAQSHRDCEITTIKLREAEVRLEERKRLHQADRQQLTILGEKNQQLHHTFEHFQTSAREQRDRDLNRWEQEKTQLQVEIRNLRDQLTSASQQLSTFNRDNGTLVAEKKDLSQQLQTQIQKNDDRRNSFEKVERRLQERQIHLDQLNERLTELVALTTRQELLLEQRSREYQQTLEQAHTELVRLRALLTDREVQA